MWLTAACSVNMHWLTQCLMYLAILLHRRIVMFGMRHQIVHVLAILLASQFIMLGVRLMAGADFPGPLYFRAQPARRGAVASVVQRDPRSVAAQDRSGCCLGCASSAALRHARSAIPSSWEAAGGRSCATIRRNCTTSRLRLAVCAGVVLLVFFLLVVRFFYVQVLQHEYYHTLAENNRISIVPIIPNRGLILDRNGAVLAHNYAAYTLEITPAKAGDLEPLINELATVVEVAPKDRKRFRKLLEEGHDFASLPIRTRLNDVEVAKFAANKFRFPGVDIRARLFRHYPNGDVGVPRHRLHRAADPE